MDIVKKPKTYFPLTHNQKSIWLDSLLLEDKATYIIGGCAVFNVELNVEAFGEAIRQVVEEADTLGITLHLIDDNPAQCIAVQQNYLLPFYDFSKEQQPESTCRQWIAEQLELPLEFEKKPPYQFALLKAREGQFFFMMKFHHLIMDGWGGNMLIHKIDAYYGKLIAGENIEHKQQLSNFQDFTYQENEYQNSKEYTQDKNYWVNKFSTLPPALLEQKKVSAPVSTMLYQTWHIPDALQHDMEALAKSLDTSLPRIWMGIIAMYFYRTTQKESLCLGLPITNRYTEAEKNTIGLFTGVVPLLLTPTPGMTFEELLRHVSATRRSDWPHQRFAIGELVNELRHTFNNVQSLYDISVNIDNVLLEMKNLDSEFVWLKRGAERKTPMTFFIKPVRGRKGWECKVTFLPEYCSDLEADRLLRRLELLIREIVRNPKQTLQEIQLIPEVEKQLLLDFCKHKNANYPTYKTIVNIFEEQVEKTPDNVALVFKNNKITYRQLNEKSNAIAQHLLQQYDIKPDDIVGLQVERNEGIVIGILGILKAGAAYLPMGTDLPEARVAFMLEDSKARLLLTNRGGAAAAQHHQGKIPVLLIEDIVAQNITNNTQNPVVALKPANLAYIIYTSGSTGNPKGVMIEHRNVVRLMVNDRPLFDFNDKDVWTLFHYYGFDFSVWEIWGALLFGGSVVVVPKQATLNPEDFANILLKNKVTVLNQVPSTFEQVQLHLLQKNQAHHIRYIIFGGAKLIPETLREWKARFPDTRLINMYGITETTVHVSYKEILQEDIDAGISNIGKTIPTLRCYILDDNKNFAPIGVRGEIYVAGDGLARGYLNNEKLTAERFVENPFESGERLYKSGDAGRWLENGEIEFFGRIDFQLKIRGFRIEAGEIEQKLMACPGIQGVVVIGKTIEDQTELVAYLSGDKKEELSLEYLRAFLAESLPGYMIPAFFVWLDKFPLTKNGKVDRKALPAPDGLALHSGTDFVKPENDVEAALVGAFAEVLNIEETAISTLDDFFNIGGDSIKLIRLVGRIYKRIGVKLSPTKIYHNSKITNLANYIQKNKQALVSDESEQYKKQLEIQNQFATLREDFMDNLDAAAGIEDVFPMSDIQRGMVFGNLLYEYQGVYHDQTVYDLQAIGFARKRFEKALHLLVDKHANLRTTFRLDHHGTDLQVVHKSIALPLYYQEIQCYHKDEIKLGLNEFLKTTRREGFDIENGPLWRMDIFQSDTNQPLLVFQFHHAIFDGWSLASLNTELLDTYHQLGSNPDFKPEPFKLSYKDFVVREMITKTDENIREFWKQELSDTERTDLFRDEIIDDEFELEIGKDYLKRLQSLAEKYDVSVKTLSLSAYLLLLDFLSPQSDLILGIISNNRLPEEEGDRLLGCFLNSVPLRMLVDKKISAKDFVRKVKDKMQSLKGNDQMTTMEIASLTGENTTEGNPIFDVIFNYIDFHIYNDLHEIGIGTERMLQADLPGVATFFERTNTYFDLMVNTTGNKLTLKVQLSRKLKAGYDAKAVLYKLLNILDVLQEKPDTRIQAIPFLSASERHTLLHDFNDTVVPYDAGKTIVDLFEEQAEKTPDRIALVFEDTEITYKELEKRSRQLAIYLREKGVRADTLVGLCMERSIEMMVAIWGILRAGGAYVPLDPGYPKERMVHMLEDGIVKGNKADAPKIIITQEQLEATIKNNTAGTNTALIVLAKDWFNNKKITNINVALDYKPTPRDLVYVIFTSGSTGKPKGTLVHHQGFFNLMHWYISAYSFHANSKFLLVSSMAVPFRRRPMNSLRSFNPSMISSGRG